jgi:tetratricopeptide (TPR) repeat protein
VPDIGDDDDDDVDVGVDEKLFKVDVDGDENDDDDDDELIPISSQTSFRNLALMYNRVGKHAEAIATFKKLVRIYQRIDRENNDVGGVNREMIAATLKDIGLIYRDKLNDQRRGEIYLRASCESSPVAEDNPDALSHCLQKVGI